MFISGPIVAHSYSLCPVDSVDQSADIFSAIGMFENLQTLRLKFDDYCAEKKPTDDDGEVGRW
jgi:hypothetical protein